MLWIACLLVGLDSPRPAASRADPAGLSCVNDMVNSVSCTWNASGVDPRAECSVLGHKTFVSRIRGRQHVSQINQSCVLTPLGGAMRGCSFVFEGHMFSWAEDMPSIQVHCNGTTADRILKYSVKDHVKMHPPDITNISASANETQISWSPGSPLCKYLDNLEFEVQIKENDKAWQAAKTLPTREQELRFLVQGWAAGLYQARVRVRPPEDEYRSQWSDWSPVASWELHTATALTPVLTFITVHTVVGLLLGLLLFITLLFIIFQRKSWLFRSKPVPDPSKYFHGPSSLHGGLKKWLNPHSTSGSYFVAHSADISPVVVVVAAAPPTSSSGAGEGSGAALPHSLSAGGTSPYSSSFSYVSSVSSSFSSSLNTSSCFSNLSYMRPASPGDGPPATLGLLCDRCPGGRGDGGVTHSGPFPPPPAAYQTPYHRGEPQSPDTGISVGMDFLADEGMDKGWEEEEEEEEEKRGNSSWEHGLSRVFLLASRAAHATAPPPLGAAPSAAPPPWTPCPADDDGEDDDDAYDADEEEYNCNPVPAGGAMGRSSSMPVEPCNSGYHTLKDLQTTYSSISI